MIERDWITAAGLQAVAYLLPGRHRTGYVRVPPGHPLHGVHYSQECAVLRGWSAATTTLGKRSPIILLTAGVDATADDGIRRSPDVVFDVHGCLTFSDKAYWTEDEDGWWFGFDCSHSGDGSLDSTVASFCHGPVRSQEYVEAECESLAQQIAELSPEARENKP